MDKMKLSYTDSELTFFSVLHVLKQVRCDKWNSNQRCTLWLL